nr:acyl-CoA carboxylase epsilon subunit [Salinibacterium sp.]
MTDRSSNSAPSLEESIPAAEISVLAGNPSPAEAAAVVAVVTSAIDELREQGQVLPAPRQDAWARSARGLRKPLVPGSWRSFTG